MRAGSVALLVGMVVAAAGCGTTPEGVTGPGRHYAVSRSHNGFTGTQALRFGPYRVEMRFDAAAVAGRNVRRGLLGAVLGCGEAGCGLPRSPRAMPLDFVFSGPAGTREGQCLPAARGMQCVLGDVRMRFDEAVPGVGAWSAETAFGPLQVVSRDTQDNGRRTIEWRVLDRNDMPLAVVGDVVPDAGDPSFSTWLADGHPDDHQALAQVVATLLAYAWHASGS